MTVSVTPPRDPMDLERIFQFLYGVWNNEFERDIPGMDHNKGWGRDPEGRNESDPLGFP